MNLINFATFLALLGASLLGVQGEASLVSNVERRLGRNKGGWWHHHNGNHTKPCKNNTKTDDQFRPDDSTDIVDDEDETTVDLGNSGSQQVSFRQELIVALQLVWYAYTPFLYSIHVRNQME